MDTYGCTNWEHNGMILYLNPYIAYTAQELIDTICHEYKHLTQNRRLYRWYQRRSRLPYQHHPLEVEARAFASEMTAFLTPPAEL